MHMLLILLALCLRRPNGISHLFSIAYAFAGNGCFHRYLPMVAFREDMRQPHHRRPPPTEPPLLPMVWDMPVQYFWQAHRDHLTDEECHIVDPLSNDHQVALPKELPGLLRQLYSHRPLLPSVGPPSKRAYQPPVP